MNAERKVIEELRTVFTGITLIGATLLMPPKGLCQGYVNFANTSTTLVRTNSTGLGGTAGNTSSNLNGFAYGLFIAPSTVTSLSPLDLLTPTWTFTGFYATNAGPATGRLSGGQGGLIAVPGWDDTTNSFVVAGWSTDVASGWYALAAQLAGASLNNGVWSGPNWLPGSRGGFFGVSEVGYGVAVDPIHPRPAFPLFGPPGGAAGTPIGTGFDLFVIPEPSTITIVMAGILIAWRRLKKAYGGRWR